MRMGGPVSRRPIYRGEVALDQIVLHDGRQSNLIGQSSVKMPTQLATRMRYLVYAST